MNILERVTATLLKAKALSRYIDDRDKGKATREFKVTMGDVYDHPVYDGKEVKP